MRRRQRRIKADTPVAKVFLEDHDDQRPLALVEAVKAELAAKRSWVLKRRARIELIESTLQKRASEQDMAYEQRLVDAMTRVEKYKKAIDGVPASVDEVFEQYNTSGTGRMTRRELMLFMQDIGLAFAAADITELVRMAERTGAGALRSQAKGGALQQRDGTIGLPAFRLLFELPPYRPASAVTQHPPWKCPNPLCAAYPENHGEATGA